MIDMSIGYVDRNSPVTNTENSMVEIGTRMDPPTNRKPVSVEKFRNNSDHIQALKSKFIKSRLFSGQ